MDIVIYRTIPENLGEGGGGALGVQDLTRSQ